MTLLGNLRKVSSFKLGLILPIVCVAFIALASPAPAAAQIQACNSTKYQVLFAYSRTWTATTASGQIIGPAVDVSGWYIVAPAACQILMTTPIVGYKFYFWGAEVGNPKANPYQGTNLRCVGSILSGTTHFQYSGAQATPPCPAGEMQMGLFLFEIPFLQKNGLPTKGATMYFEPGPNG